MCELVERYAKQEVKRVAQKLFESGVEYEIVQASVELPEEVLREIYESVVNSK